MLVERVKGRFITVIHKYLHKEGTEGRRANQDTTGKLPVRPLAFLFFVIVVLSAWHTATASNHDFQFFWVKQAGNSRGLSIATDSEGHILVIGDFGGTATFDGVTLTATPREDNVFIAKYARDGTFIWAKQISGISNPDNDIATDSAGNVYVTGMIIGRAVFDDVTLSAVGGYDIFLAKYAPDGTLLWVRQAGGDDTFDDKDFLEAGMGIATDNAGNAFVAGGFLGTDAFGARSRTFGRFRDIFVAKYNADGTLLWMRTAGGTDYSNDWGWDLATDRAGNVFVVGTIGDPVLGFGESYGNDMFLAKYDPYGTLIWAKQVPGPVIGSWPDRPNIVTDGLGNIFVKGSFYNMIAFDGVSLHNRGRSQQFIAKFNSDGMPQWAKEVEVFMYDIAVDQRGNVFTIGEFSGTANFDGSSVASAGYRDIFVAKYDPSGNFLAVKTAGGWRSYQRGRGIATDSAGDVVITGQIRGPATLDALRVPEDANIIVAKLGTPSDPDRYAGNEGLDRAASVSEVWEHPRHWRCSERIRSERWDPEAECPDIFEHGSLQPGYGAEEVWTMVIPDLSITSTTERDFFRVSIPDPSDPDDGGHSDIRPSTPPRDSDPEPLPECGIVQREGSDLLGNPITIDIPIIGKLVVKVIPTSNSASARPVSEEGETIQLYRDRDGTLERDDELGSPEGGSLQKTIICPRSRKDLSELVFSFGERVDPRPNLSSTGGYTLLLEYKIEISREFSPPVFAEQLEQLFVGGISCLYLVDPFIDPVSLPRDDFPYCPSVLDIGFSNFRTPFRLEMGHPMDASRRCDGEGCPEFYVIQWPSTGAQFDVTFASAADLSFTLYDAEQNLIGEAVPFEPNGGLETRSEINFTPLSVNTLQTALQTDQIKKRLFIPQLVEGMYVLEVKGPEALYTFDFVPLAEVSSVEGKLSPFLWILLILILIAITVFWVVIARRKKRRDMGHMT